jgi:hypothetical protein
MMKETRIATGKPLETERESTRSHSVVNSLWKALWTCSELVSEHILRIVEPLHHFNVLPVAVIPFFWSALCLFRYFSYCSFIDKPFHTLEGFLRI